jgi:hypothetical protein
MIYLFEDRKGRMQQYFNKALDTRLVEEKIFDCSAESIESYMIENFKDAECIIFHKSYSFPQDGITNNDVKQAFVNRKVPFVFFSGELKNNLLLENGIYTGTVNSGVMYNNLDRFIETYKKERKINIPLLVFGENYLLNSLLNLQYKINNMLFMKSKEDTLDEELLEEIKDEVILSINEADLAKDKDKIVKWLECNMDKKRISTLLLKSQIQMLIDKY